MRFISNMQHAIGEAMKYAFVRILISTVILLIAALHILFPAIAIDAATIALLILAAVPWLLPLLKSMEIPGGFKFDFRELERVGQEASDVGLVAESLPDRSAEDEPLFVALASRDPTLALAGLRIEIEKRLVHLANTRALGTQYQGVGILTRRLASEGAISEHESMILKELVIVLNKAIHAEEIEPKAAIWAMDVGRRILATLDERIHKAQPGTP